MDDKKEPLFAEAEWPIDADGFPHRNAARVVIFNDVGETFLLRGHDYGKSSSRWWFTVGGGQEVAETPRETACRELFEETGLRLNPDRLLGPILFRKSIFRFYLKTRKQDENFFLLFVTPAEVEIINKQTNVNFTDMEKQVIEAKRWWKLEDLALAVACGQTVYPLQFVSYAETWRNGWDGTLLEITEK